VPPGDELAAFVADLPISRRAAAWAAEVHEGQVRQVDGAPFVAHPYEVALLVHGAGYRDEIVAIALLHDVLEKTDVTPAALSASFGPEVAAAVAAMSEDESIADYETRKAALRDSAEAASDEVLAVFGADKVVKAREIRLAAAADRLLARDVARRRAHYVASLEILERRLPGHPFTEALRFELTAHLEVPALAWLRPTGAPEPVPPR
jgi:(p)ppGpp synthase/HD superfamily hydrolase